MKMSGRGVAQRKRARALVRVPLAVAVCMALQWPALALAQDGGTQQDDAAQSQDQPRTLGKVTVTAQKREENLQEVPISIQALGEQTLEQHDVADFDDFAKLVPSLSYGTAGGGVFSGPGFLQVYMRGVASGGDGNHSGSRPSVGVYLDEQPITTITGALDVHMFDIARVEALAGPQGTLYGASSQAGTLRIITNKPDPSGFEAKVAAELNTIEKGGTGHVLEAMANLPLSPASALRLVGWQKHEAGYVDNVPGTVTFPTSGIVADNEGFVEDNYNEAFTAGARAALRIDLDDNWTISPTVMGQTQDAYGSNGYDPSVGELEVSHGYPEYSKDKWLQAALTVEGKIGNFDLTYTWAHTAFATSTRRPTTPTTGSGTTRSPATAPTCAPTSTRCPSPATRIPTSIRRSTSSPATLTAPTPTNCASPAPRTTAGAWSRACSGRSSATTSNRTTRSTDCPPCRKCPAGRTPSG